MTGNGIAKPMGAPTSYKPEFCERVIELGKQGYSPSQIASDLEIGRASLHDWGKKYIDFSAALTRAKNEEQAYWEKTGHDSLKADKFQAQVWKKSMEARFRDDYTERQHVEHKVSGGVDHSSHNVSLAILAVLQDADLDPAQALESMVNSTQLTHSPDKPLITLDTHSPTKGVQQNKEGTPAPAHDKKPPETAK